MEPSSARGSWEEGSGQAKALGDLGLLCNKTSDSTWWLRCVFLPSYPSRVSRKPQAEPPHSLEPQTHCGGWGGWGTGGHGAHGQLAGSGLAQEMGPAPDHPPWLASTPTTPSKGHTPGQRKAEGRGAGGWGCRESVSIREAPGPSQAPPSPARRGWVLAYCILLGYWCYPTQGHPSGKAKDPDTPSPAVRVE